MFRRWIASLLVVSLALPLPVHAGMVATENALERSRIVNLLERADVQAQLQAYGVSPGDVKARVAALTDAEAAELAARIDELPAGGVSVLGAALIVFLVLLLTDILGYTKIFPFTRPVK
ncbi:MAG TPA: PA2779 family protein [Burkholderiales bacterium]|nr:PA2779 family protein [Burkholderiales bacterium]